MQSLNALRCSTLIAVLALCASASAQIKVGVVTSATGPVALVGIQQKNTVSLLPTSISGQAVEYIQLDDASDPTTSVSAVKKLIAEKNIDALIGPSGSPNAMGVLQVVADAQVPTFAAVGTAAVILPMNDRKRWVFKPSQNDDLIASALVAHMASSGIKTAGFIGVQDSYGENWLSVFSDLAAKSGIKVVDSESYARTDTSLTAQALKIIGYKPDAVLIAAPGGSAVLPQTTLFDVGYKGKVYQTHGAAFPEFLKLGGKKVEGTVLAVSSIIVAEQMPDTTTFKPLALKYIDAYQKAYKQRPTVFGAGVYDAGLLLQAAIPVALKTGATPGTPAFRSALRDAVEGVKSLPSSQGVYTMTAQDHSGFDERGRVLVTVRDGQWALLK